MKTPSLLIALLIYIQIIGQESVKTDFYSEIKEYDISNLLILEDFLIEDNTFEIVRPHPLGFIGDTFQRFHIRFISMIKNPSNPIEYLVYGKTKIKNKICSFQGKITLTKSKIYNTSEHSTRTSEYHFLKNKHNSLKHGIVSGEYEFYEDQNQKGAGIYKGKFVSRFFFANETELKYDVLMWSADEYANNQFEGTWTDYKTGDSIDCNWGDFRIPNCEDLDIGTSEFVPNKKYKDLGWESYQLSIGNSTDDPKVLEARNKEDKKWWLVK